jgi:hypothetical protein
MKERTNKHKQGCTIIYNAMAVSDDKIILRAKKKWVPE